MEKRENTVEYSHVSAVFTKRKCEFFAHEGNVDDGKKLTTREKREVTQEDRGEEEEERGEGATAAER